MAGRRRDHHRDCFTNATTVMFGASLAPTTPSSRRPRSPPPPGAGRRHGRRHRDDACRDQCHDNSRHFTYEARRPSVPSARRGLDVGSTTWSSPAPATPGTVVDFGSGAGGFIVNSPPRSRPPAGRGRGPGRHNRHHGGGHQRHEPADQYTFVVPPTSPTSTSSGPVAGQASVAITGTGFIVPGFGSGSAVDFGSAPAAFIVNSSTSITASAPAGTPDGRRHRRQRRRPSATNAADKYTYVTGPTSPPSPDGGPPGRRHVCGHNGHRLLGTGFPNASAVDFGSAAAASSQLVHFDHGQRPVGLTAGPVDIT